MARVRPEFVRSARRAVLPGALALALLPGCVFFDGFELCDAQSGQCPQAGGGSGGSGNVDGGGSGAALGAGGSGAANADGGADGSGGANGGGANGGGTSAGGGTSGGGTSGGGTSGGGGAGSGGSGSGALARPRINEVRVLGSQWIELYNAGSETALASGVFVTTGTPGKDFVNVCQLESDLAPGEFVVLMDTSGTCPTDPPFSCQNCNFTLSSLSTIYVVDESDEELDTLVYPDGDGAPSSGNSWQAIPDGSGTFTAATATPGISNE